MSKKKTTFKPTAELRDIEKVLDNWVDSDPKLGLIKQDQEQQAITEPQAKLREDIKFSVTLPVYLHRRLKKSCAARGVSMREQIKEIFESHFPES